MSKRAELAGMPQWVKPAEKVTVTQRGSGVLLIKNLRFTERRRRSSPQHCALLRPHEVRPPRSTAVEARGNTRLTCRPAERGKYDLKGWGKHGAWKVRAKTKKKKKKKKITGQGVSKPSPLALMISGWKLWEERCVIIFLFFFFLSYLKPWFALHKQQQQQ